MPTTARKELLDCFASANPPAVRIEQLTSNAYQQGFEHGCEFVENAAQNRLENWFIAGMVAGMALAGTLVFFMSL
jgi:hypothetical protein